MSPLRGDHIPEPTIWGYLLESPAKFNVNWSSGFSTAAFPKLPFPMLVLTTLSL